VINTHGSIAPVAVSRRSAVSGDGRRGAILRPSPREIAENPALASAPALPRELRVVRPQRIIVHEIQSLTGTQIDVSFMTAETTLGRALMAAGYALYEADRVTPHLDTPVDGPLDVTIERATPVTLRADGLVREVRTRQR
jgi:hypothetical protein